MNYEQKYKEALERAKAEQETFLKRGNISAKTAIENIFPELKESEDERIKKEIIYYLDREITLSNFGGDIAAFKKWIAWLEKQNEKKPANKVEPKFKVGDTIKYIGEREEFSKEKHTIKKILDDCYLTIDDVYIPFKFEEYYILVNQKSAWSEEDEYQINTILHGLDLKRELYKKEENQVEEKRYKTQYDWLKSIKDRVQPKQEWSEEDEKMLDSIIDCIDGLIFIDSDQLNWLKSLKPQNRWKPSEEQMEALNAINNVGELSYVGQGDLLVKLYQDLKKL